MKATNLEQLGVKCAEIMMRGAAEFIRVRGLRAADVDCARICEEIRKRAPAAIAEALRDAGAALELPGMELIAEATFASTFRLAGIDAAKAVIEPQQ